MATIFQATAIVIYRVARRLAIKPIQRLRENDAQTMPTRNDPELAMLMTIATVATGGIFRAL